jgi:hypothetical protein
MGGILSVLFLVFIGKAQGQIHSYFYFCYRLIRRVDRDTRNVPQSGLIAVQWRTAFEHRPQHSFQNTDQSTDWKSLSMLVTVQVAGRCLLCALLLKRIRFLSLRAVIGTEICVGPRDFSFTELLFLSCWSDILTAHLMLLCWRRQRNFSLSFSVPK